MDANGTPVEVEVSTFTQFPYDITVAAYVGREYAEDGGGVYRQIHLASQGVEGEQGDNADWGALLSIGEARAVRDLLTAAIFAATYAPDPEENTP